jgi:hypothetical protein
VPIIEAQAWGPVVAADHSAMTELRKVGWLVGGDPWWMVSTWLTVPSVGGIHTALEAAYERRGDQELRDAAAGFAAAYDADTVTQTFWRPALDVLTGPRQVKPLHSVQVTV